MKQNKSYTLYAPVYNIPVTVTAPNKHIAAGMVKHKLGLRSTERLVIIGANL